MLLVGHATCPQSFFLVTTLLRNIPSEVISVRRPQWVKLPIQCKSWIYVHEIGRKPETSAFPLHNVWHI